MAPPLHARALSTFDGRDDESALDVAGPGRAVALDARISVRILRGLFEVVERATDSAEPLRAASRLTREQLDSAATFISFGETLELMELAAQLTGDDALGLHWAETFSKSTFAPITHLLAHAPTLRHAFSALERFSRLISDPPGYEVVESGGSVTVRMGAIPFSSLRLRHLVSEMVVAGFTMLVRDFNPRAQLTQIAFSYDAPEHAPEYARVFRQAVSFGQGFDGLIFDASLLDQTCRHADPDVHRAMESLAEQRLMSVTERTPYATRLHAVLVERSPVSHRPDMAQAARALGVSARSLRRRLTEEGTSFTAVLNEAQLTLAKRLLLDRRYSVQEVAYEMGFADPSAFHRAFRRWAGTTPSAYRSAALGS